MTKNKKPKTKKQNKKLVEETAKRSAEIFIMQLEYNNKKSKINNLCKKEK